MKSKELPSQSHLKSLYYYDYETGVLYNKKTGKNAGSQYSNGYIYVSINKNRYLAHRLIFQMHFGFCPENLDHKNQIRTDNRIENLRPATYQENCRNRKVRFDSASGVAGVRKNKKPGKQWISYITVDAKVIYLGFFDELEKAIQARRAAEFKYFGSFAPGNGAK